MSGDLPPGAVAVADHRPSTVPIDLIVERLDAGATSARNAAARIRRTPSRTISSGNDELPERRLAETTEEACSAGAFGVPTFVVDGGTYWDNDRLVLLRHYIDP